MLTQPQSRLATPAYAAPEQLCDGPITVATDVFSAGVLLFELVTGHRPFLSAPTGSDAAEAPRASQRADAAAAGLPDGNAGRQAAGTNAAWRPRRHDRTGLGARTRGPLRIGGGFRARHQALPAGHADRGQAGRMDGRHPEIRAQEPHPGDLRHHTSAGVGRGHRPASPGRRAGRNARQHAPLPSRTS